MEKLTDPVIRMENGTGIRPLASFDLIVRLTTKLS